MRCQITLETDLRSHEKSIHKGNDTLQRTGCHYNFTQETDLKSHTNLAHQKKGGI